MSIQVVVQTQRVVVSPGIPRIVFNPATKTVSVIADPRSIAVINAGPPGPPGSIASFDLVPVLAVMDTKIATHNQATPIHPGATSGRDFVALFQNGLV